MNMKKHLDLAQERRMDSCVILGIRVGLKRKQWRRGEKVKMRRLAPMGAIYCPAYSLALTSVILFLSSVCSALTAE